MRNPSLFFYRSDEEQRLNFACGILREFLTGFRKRKQKREEEKKEKRKEREKKERLETRKQVSSFVFLFEICARGAELSSAE